MAFVYRSPRVDNFGPKIETDYQIFSKNPPHPTDESSLNSQLHSSYNKAPFGISSKKITLNSYTSTNYPGPGTYNLRGSILKANYHINKTSPNHSLIDDEEEDKIFISQEKRKFDYGIKNNNPGPGKYFKNKKKRSYKNNYKIMKKENKYDTFSDKRILSIPTKGENFGYDETKGTRTKFEDPDKSIKFTGEKNDSVGPGQYNSSTYSYKNNKIGILDWNKSIIRNIKKENESNYCSSTKTTEPTFNESLQVVNFNPKNKLVNYFNTFNGKNRRNLEIRLSNNSIYKNINLEKYLHGSTFNNKILNKNNNQNSINDETQTKNYSNYSLNTLCVSPKNEKFQFFGSSTSRGILYPKIKNNIKIGPIMKSSNLHLDIVSNKEQNNNIQSNNISQHKSINNLEYKKMERASVMNNLSKKLKNEINANLGPGTYDPEKIPSKNFEYAIENFGSLEKRFPSKTWEENEYPGSGAYLDIKVWGPKKKVQNLSKRIPENIRKRNLDGISANKMCLFRKKIMEESNKSPSVGYYDIGMINSIQGNVNKSKSLRKDYFEKYYFKVDNKDSNINNLHEFNADKNKQVKIYQQNAPFLEISGRYDLENYRQKKLYNPNIGPGTYKKDSYFDWNKKSFNMLFN